MDKQTKKCTNCGAIKSLELFSIGKQYKDGRQYSCKVCQSIACKAGYAANPEKEKARGKAWREENPDKTKASGKAWREANPDYQKVWRKANPEKGKGYSKTWRDKNPDKSKAIARVATKKWRTANPDKVSIGNKSQRETLRKDVFNGYGNKCSVCGETDLMVLELDHVNNDGGAHRKEIGCSRGGGSSVLRRWVIKNKYPPSIQLLCGNCHAKKTRLGKGNQCKECSQQQYIKIKIEVVKRYGGHCKFCGEVALACLELHHISSDGNQHRKEIEANIYRWAHKNNCPNTLQLLCANCHTRMHRGGIKCLKNKPMPTGKNRP